jgi:hypothetical protein
VLAAGVLFHLNEYGETLGQCRARLAPIRVSVRYHYRHGRCSSDLCRLPLNLEHVGQDLLA